VRPDACDLRESRTQKQAASLRRPCMRK
jgi:hypothetical protein